MLIVLLRVLQPRFAVNRTFVVPVILRMPRATFYLIPQKGRKRLYYSISVKYTLIQEPEFIIYNPTRSDGTYQTDEFEIDEKYVF